MSAGSLSAGTSSANAVGAYYPSGPQRNVPISTITSGGWTLCWSSLFSANDTLANIESSCTGNYLLEAGGVVGASSYLLAAAGERSSVLGVTSQNQTNLNNGTYWYYYKGSGGMMGGGSMGFSPISTIFQNSADCYYNGALNCGFASAIVEGQDPTVDLRMSWHVYSTTIGSGWRIGRLTSLYDGHVRAIYQSNAMSSAPGAPTSVTATSTGATTANVSFTAPTSDGGAAITSYTATSSPGGITGTISQATSGTIAMTGLTAGTAYTFTVRATNSAGTSVASSPSNSVTTVGAPGAPTSVVATSTGKRSATVSFAAPASNGGSAVTSNTATSTPDGISKTLTQATGGTFNFDGLQPGTAYTFAVTATNAIGTSSAATSNSITTTPLVVASLSSLSFVDDGTGTGGKIVWAGKSIDAVLYTGPANSYPGPYNYGAFTGGWNGRIRNLTPGTEYTVSLYAVSADGVGESKSLTFKTSATLPALAGAASANISRADEMTTQLPKLSAWIDENVFVDGEGNRMKMMLNKFDLVTTSKRSAYLTLPNSLVTTVSAISSTPLVCKVEGRLTIHSIAAGTCTISYTVSGRSKAPATMVKDFVFAKFDK
jgi:chitodextrinase